MKKKSPAKYLLTLFFISIAFWGACKHESTESKAILTIVSNLTSTGQEIPVADATVIMSLDTTTTAKRDPSFPRIKKTDASGKVEFVFANGIVVNIHAYKEIGPSDTIRNKTFIAINTGETAEKKIILRR